MVTYEIVSIASAVLSSFVTGCAYMLYRQNERAYQSSMSDLREAKELLFEKVHEFDDITRKASEANNSMASKIIDMETQIGKIDDRISMHFGQGNTSTGSKTWQQNPLRR